MTSANWWAMCAGSWNIWLVRIILELRGAFSLATIGAELSRGLRR